MRLDPRPRGAKLPFRTKVVLNVLAAVVVLSLVQAFVVKVYRIPSGSMEQTLQGSLRGGDRVLVNRTEYAGSRDVEPGDIVVFAKPDEWNLETGTKPTEGILASAARVFGDLTGIGPSSEQYQVKRVVARDGQTIACCDSEGRLQRDGQGIEEPYVYQDLPFEAGARDCMSTPRSVRCFGPFTVPEGELVVLGDYRSSSADSAAACRTPTAPPADCMRTVAEDSVKGRVFARIWPINRLRGL